MLRKHQRHKQEIEELRDPEKVARGRVAQELLNDPVFTDAIEAAEGEFIRDWLAAEDVSTREMCRAKVAVLEEVQRQLSLTVKKGEYAALSSDS
jgi:hypothetical protein